LQLMEAANQPEEGDREFSHHLRLAG
jgi:hypothetical protein